MRSLVFVTASVLSWQAVIAGAAEAEDSEETCALQVAQRQAEAKSYCSVGTNVACPGSGAMCAGNQCCPGTSASKGQSFPCPSADSSYKCQTRTKVENCREPTKEPTVVGEGEKCNGSLPPQYATICEEGFECKVPGVPWYQMMGMPGVCTAKGPTVVGEGETCNPSLPPAYATVCEEGFECKVPGYQMMGKPGVCTAKGPTVVGEGETCNPSISPAYATVCEEGLECKVPGYQMMGKRGVCTARSYCSATDTMACPGSSGMCVGNQCCPGTAASGGKTFPCPNADASYKQCATKTKVEDCLAPAS